MDGFFFTREGLTGILEAADIIKSDMISPYINVLMDRVTYQMETCRLSTMFTKYVDITADVCETTKSEEWKAEEISMLA